LNSGKDKKLIKEKKMVVSFPSPAIALHGPVHAEI